jgi:hypothetical protein
MMYGLTSTIGRLHFDEALLTLSAEGPFSHAVTIAMTPGRLAGLGTIGKNQ